VLHWSARRVGVAETTAAKAARVAATLNCMLSKKSKVLKRLWKLVSGAAWAGF
jgi:hypothetical protein